MYRAVRVCARDGYSGIIVEFAAIPIKNPKNNTKKNINNNTKSSLQYTNTRPDLFLNFLTFLFTFIMPLFFMLFFNGLDM